MTAFSITISQSVRVFGPATTDNWDVFHWNAFLWGYGTQTLPKNVVHLIDPSAQQVSPTAAVAGKRITKVISEAQPSTLGFSGEVQDGQTGYDRVFPESVSNIASMSTPAWTPVTSAAVSWTTLAAASTTWSSV